ncbi:hypothetical protein PIB30_018676 [Stylosanthes scabra]|uniref:Uncharacterized protein n=1 Tax=Stylosanthes scabra TaxID=79078 RepID=A0ABU6V7D4_9FABA|nr:hypothetical protein [Stylosanthes scabra]
MVYIPNICEKFQKYPYHSGKDKDTVHFDDNAFRKIRRCKQNAISSSSFTSLHITALDAIVNVYSLFTIAIIVGLSWNPNDPSNNLNHDPACSPTAAIAENLVYSFRSFLFSSLVALTLKQVIRLSRNHHFFIRYLAVVEFIAACINRSASALACSSPALLCGWMHLPYVRPHQRCPDQAWNTRLRHLPCLRRRCATRHTRSHRLPYLRFRCSFGFARMLIFEMRTKGKDVKFHIAIGAREIRSTVKSTGIFDTPEHLNTVRNKGAIELKENQTELERKLVSSNGQMAIDPLIVDLKKSTRERNKSKRLEDYTPQ